MSPFDRVRVYNEGLLHGLRRASELFSERFDEARRAFEQEIAGRTQAYELRLSCPAASDIEAGARALCIVSGLDPDKGIRDPSTGDTLPMWTFRRAEAEACFLAAAASGRLPIPGEGEASDD